MWRTTNVSDHVEFAPAGIARRRGIDAVQHFDWACVENLDIRIPYASVAQWRLLTAVNLLGPAHADGSRRDTEISFRSGRHEVQWNLGRSGRYSWRIQFLVSELLSLIERRNLSYAVLARPGLLDRLVSEIAPKVPRRARLLMYADLFGLDRLWGGHGAWDAALDGLIAEMA